ncbi:MAG: hypothetical protein Q3976_08555 [Corynebacterium sp.]|nr:hypothetical protein [Corynebacterium sp.]
MSTKKNSHPKNEIGLKEFFSEFFSAKNWLKEGIGLFVFAVVISLIFTGTLNIGENWDLYAFALGFAVAGGVPYFLRPRFSRSVCAVLAVISVIAVELAFYLLVYPGR